MRVDTLPPCRARRRQALATAAEQNYANALLYENRQKPGFLPAAAELFHRSPRSVSCWQDVPALHVRPFMDAVQSGKLCAAMQRHAPQITSADRTRATDIVHEMRRSQTGLSALCKELKAAPSLVRKWNAAPLRHVSAILARFGSHVPAAGSSHDVPVVKLATSKASVSGLWHRNCLFCRKAFKVDSPFIRRCDAHRGDG
ncbi:hypothetical protein [Asaia astilbis]|uniref:hypothetical protein n=1 Tax=Asaia astilbis TaxID=610244 RepID=UPI00046F8350|nr:hypothetical protein [Asaia astilbis]